MPNFSEKSKERLSTCHPELQRLMNEVIKEYDFSIICGYRNEEDQNIAYKNGKSKLQYPNSNHNTIPTLAVDIAPYIPQREDKNAWKDARYFHILSGFVLCTANRLGIKIRWGGDWNSNFYLEDQDFNDLPHFELKDAVVAASDTDVSQNTPPNA